MRRGFKSFAISLAILLGIVVLSEFIFKRFDMTQDKRYTLSDTTYNILEQIENPLKISVLLGGELSGDYRTLKNEISFILDEFRNINLKISYEFIYPNKEFNNEALQSSGFASASVLTDKGVI